MGEFTMVQAGQCYCPICGSRVEYDVDYMDHLLMEYSVCCGHCGLWSDDYCGLWSDDYRTGNHRNSTGFCEESGWGWTETPERVREVLTRIREYEEETRRLWADPEYENWKHVPKVRPEDDFTLWLVFADWLQERGFRHNERGVRALVEVRSR